ncbi:hypothetical protein G9A89_007895 [Geosiphon pyriformis]|nr:hypothetical protein G9A89_007895 [Geosiphon pyriformis]
MKSLFLCLSLISSSTFLISKSYAWGSEGHVTIGNIAQNILTPDVAIQVKNLLQDKGFDGLLGPASLWADRVKHEKNGEFAGWSAPLHYMDTHDEPGKGCAVNQKADCPEGQCIVGAIANYTTQLDCANGGSLRTRDIALRFLAHFFGDITQPLHVCGREVGGNKHEVKFNGGKKNLHSVWDTGLVVKRLADFENSEDKYAEFLTNEVLKGSFTSNSSDWIACDGRSARRRRGLDGLIQKRAESTTRCPFIWATDTNGINCEVVWEYVDANPDADLAGEYYKLVKPYIDVQIAKGGYRLGTFLNNILGGNNKTCSNDQTDGGKNNPSDSSDDNNNTPTPKRGKKKGDKKKKGRKSSSKNSLQVNDI